MSPTLRSLPASIWLEMHLEKPFRQRAYLCAVTLMGAPGVIIGYNQAMYGGRLSVGPDARDYYHLRYADDKGAELLVQWANHPASSSA